MKTKLLTVFILFSISVFAKPENNIPDSVSSSINQIRSILNSGEWKAVDSLNYQRLITLVQLAEESNTDSMLNKLRVQSSTNNIEHFVYRDIDAISDRENIPSYISDWELSKELELIEAQTKLKYPLDSIYVPDSVFEGDIFSNKLHGLDSIKQRLADSTAISYFEHDSLFFNLRKQSTDSTIALNIDSILNSKIDVYNGMVIKAINDSITNNYRIVKQQSIIDSMSLVYEDSIQFHNLQVLNEYNIMESNWINDELDKTVNTLISYVDGQPNKVVIRNLKDETVDLMLQNNVEWFQWVWLKNAQNDSIGLRVENKGKNEIKVLVDETVNLSRLTEKRNIDVGRIELTTQLDSKLSKMNVKKPKVSPWKLGGKAYAGFTETFINQYWSKGGKTSASTLATLSYDANYAKNKVKWENGIDAKLGLIASLLDEDEDPDTRYVHKNSDNFEFNSRFGYSAFKEWYYSAEANFKTQFFDGFKSSSAQEPNSSLFSPAYLTFSAGFDFKPNKKYSMFIAPLSVKTTYVTDDRIDETRFGIVEGETRKTRMGLSGKIQYQTDITPDIAIKTKNGIFVNYGLNTEGEWQLTKIPDFDSETTLDFKVNQFITTQINFHFIYDKDVQSKWTDDAGLEQTGTKLQVKQFFTLGFSYRFLNPFS